MNFLFANLLNEGGPLFMYTNLILLIVCILLIIGAFTKKEQAEKMTHLIKHISLFALVWGFLGFFIGMIYAFDSISLSNDIAPSVLAGGLKIGLLSPSFGLVVFLIARAGIIALVLKKK
jgi:biopolymer transport protein ExbB/TolQ